MDEATPLGNPGGVAYFLQILDVFPNNPCFSQVWGTFFPNIGFFFLGLLSSYKKFTFSHFFDKFCLLQDLHNFPQDVYAL